MQYVCVEMIFLFQYENKWYNLYLFLAKYEIKDYNDIGEMGKDKL